MEDRMLENQIVNTEAEENEITYKIYDYFKNNHTLLIAFVSAFIASASFATSVLVYLYYSLVLQRWNVSVDFVEDVTRGKYFYVAVIGILYYSLIPHLYIFLRSKYSEFFYYVPIFRMRIRLIEKRIKIIENKKKKIKKQNKKTTCVIKEIRRDMKRINQEITNYVLGIVLVAGIIYFILVMVFQIAMGAIRIENWIFCGMVVVFCMLYLFFDEKKKFKKYDVKLLRAKVKRAKNKEEMETLDKELADLITENEVESVENKTLRDLLCDKNINTFIGTITGAFLILLVCFVMLGYSEAPARKEFWVYQDNTGQDYAVIYHDENIVILEKAFIEDSTISINLNEQRFMKPEGNNFKNIKFDNVIRVDKN